MCDKLYTSRLSLITVSASSRGIPKISKPKVSWNCQYIFCVNCSAIPGLFFVAPVCVDVESEIILGVALLVICIPSSKTRDPWDDSDEDVTTSTPVTVDNKPATNPVPPRSNESGREAELVETLSADDVVEKFPPVPLEWPSSDGDEAGNPVAAQSTFPQIYEAPPVPPVQPKPLDSKDGASTKPSQPCPIGVAHIPVHNHSSHPKGAAHPEPYKGGAPPPAPPYHPYPLYPGYGYVSYRPPYPYQQFHPPIAPAYNFKPTY